MMMMLDTPEIFWSEPALQPMYVAIRGKLQHSSFFKGSNDMTSNIHVLRLLGDTTTSQDSQRSIKSGVRFAINAPRSSYQFWCRVPNTHYYLSHHCRCYCCLCKYLWIGLGWMEKVAHQRVRVCVCSSRLASRHYNPFALCRRRLLLYIYKKLHYTTT